MTSKKIFISILLISVLIIFQSDKLKSPFLTLFNNIKVDTIYIYDSISLSINKYFYQSEHIEKLTLENKKLEDSIASYKAYINSCKNLSYFENLNIKNIKFAQTISYAKLPILSQIYINYESNSSNIKGLIYNGQSAGIVVKSYNNFSLALLNSDKETTYTVFIKNSIPGILFGGDKIVIKYIPKYHKININDEVTTSGLDNIFYQGVKVGIINKIIQTDLYQEAEITPYYNSLKPSLFYVVE
jgi:rod shape-determining protein MreC